MRKHTPGPWHVEPAIGPNNTDCGRIVTPTLVGEYRGQVASCYDAEHIDGITVAERNANAALIAAAPDLLSALESIVAVMTTEYVDPGQWRSMARPVIITALNAIAKARGDA